MVEGGARRLDRSQVQAFMQLDQQVVWCALQQISVDVVAEPLQERGQVCGDERQHKVGYNRHRGLRCSDDCGLHLQSSHNRGPLASLWQFAG